MTKADLIDEVSRLAELTRKDSEVIVETIFDSIVRSLRVGDKIEIRGFGSFRTRQRKPRVGRNPKTGERVEVPAKKIPFFKPSKELKDLVNTGAPPAPAQAQAPPPAPQWKWAESELRLPKSPGDLSTCEICAIRAGTAGQARSYYCYFFQDKASGIRVDSSSSFMNRNFLNLFF